MLRGMVLFAVASRTVRRRYGVFRILGFQVLRLPESEGVVFHFHFGKPF